MKISDNKIIKSLNFLATLAIVFFVVFLIFKLASVGAPSSSNSLKGFEMYDVIARPIDTTIKPNDYLDIWFKNKVVVQPTNRSLVHLRIKSYQELFSLPSILFQAMQMITWLLIGFLLICVKKIFMAFSKNNFFSNSNGSIIISGAIVLICLPFMQYITQELFINCVNKLKLNDSGYQLYNGTHYLGPETLIGLVLLAFGFAFKSGANLKRENESFI